MKKAECVFPNRPLNVALCWDKQHTTGAAMEKVALLIREKSEAAGGVPEDIQEAYWKIWWYLDCPLYCFTDV